jgi:intracellular multiplication protein IcmL
MADLTTPNESFYNGAYKSRFRFLILMVLLNILLLVWIYYWVTHPKKPDYFMVMSEGKLEKIFSIDQPVVSSAELFQWATISATTLNTYNFVNWRKVFQESSANFTPAGWQEFQAAIKTSATLDTVISNKLSVSAVATGAPVILEKGILNGAYKWRVQLPLLLTYESANKTTFQPVFVTMLITRTSSADSFRGIAIEAFYMVDDSMVPS